MAGNPKTAFEEGKRAAADGKPLDGNPYPPGSADHADWKSGFEFVNEYDEDGEIPSEG